MSDGACDVRIGEYDGDQAEFSCITRQVARKQHVCCECHEPIQIGGVYVKWVGKWDGAFDTWKFCAACYAIAHEFSEGGITIGVLWDELQENWAQGAHLQACLNRLATVEQKALMTRKWRKWKGLD